MYITFIMRQVIMYITFTMRQVIMLITFIMRQVIMFITFIMRQDPDRHPLRVRVGQRPGHPGAFLKHFKMFKTF